MADTVAAPTDEQKVVTDESPALAAVAPELDELHDAEGVDFTTRPPFRELHRDLPKNRAKRTARVMEIVKSFPKEWTQEGADVSVDSIDPEVFAKLIEDTEDFVVDAAQDPTAMEDWLIDQEDGFTAVIATFAELAEKLGK